MRKRKVDRRARILETAEMLFSRYGAKRVSVEELCREAGVSKPTFYKHFRNKVELVRTIRDAWVEEGFAKFDEISAMDVSFPEKIDLMTAWKARFASRVNAGFIRELVSTEDAQERFKRGYLGNVRKAQEKGEVRDDIDPEFLWMVVEKLGELFTDGAWKKVSRDPGAFQAQVRTLLWYGLLSREEMA